MDAPLTRGFVRMRRQSRTIRFSLQAALPALNADLNMYLFINGSGGRYANCLKWIFNTSVNLIVLYLPTG